MVLVASVARTALPGDDAVRRRCYIPVLSILTHTPRAHDERGIASTSSMALEDAAPQWQDGAYVGASSSAA